MFRIEREGVESLLRSLRQRGYTVFGPRIQDGTIVHGEIDSIADFPAGWTDEQSPARYRLSRRNDDALFGYSVGPSSWKRYLFPPILKLFAIRRRDFTYVDGDAASHAQAETDQEQPKLAFIGVRPCEVSALAVQDRVFLNGPFCDPHYKNLRERLFIVAVNCTQAAATCFCTSMNTGPRAAQGFDLALTEVVDDREHFFVVEAGSERGEEVLEELEAKEAGGEDVEAANCRVEQAASSIVRHLETDGLKELLYANSEHPRWEAIAKRCLTCANCTMVCPTCFCSTVEDVTDLYGEIAERWRKWDSCFTVEFSYIHGGSIRATPRARYRHWMTHKLASWIDQFGTSGCVGCGRCITWCPVGIDITEEARSIREHQHAPVTSP